MYSPNEPAVLSDCVIAIQAGTFEETRVVFSLIQAKWPLIERMYVGTCARYQLYQTCEQHCSK